MQKNAEKLQKVKAKKKLLEKQKEANLEISKRTAILRGVRLSAQKGRLVADMIRGKSVEQALYTLQFTQRKAAVIIKKVLESAIANAEHNAGEDIDELKVKTIHVEQGPTLKRFTARAKGRGNRILKPTSHVYITVGN